MKYSEYAYACAMEAPTRNDLRALIHEARCQLSLAPTQAKIWDQAADAMVEEFKTYWGLIDYVDILPPANLRYAVVGCMLRLLRESRCPEIASKLGYLL